MGRLWGLRAMLVTFREQGILRRFHVTPVTAADMLASSILANYLLTIPTVLIELLFARIIFHVANLGDLLSLFVLPTVATSPFASLASLFATPPTTIPEHHTSNQ